VDEPEWQGVAARHRQAAGHDPVGPRAGHQRADGKAQFVEQARVGELRQQVRAALAGDPLEAALGQRVHRRLHIDAGLARDDHVRVPCGRGIPAGGHGGRGGDDDRPGVREGAGDQRAVQVQVEFAGDHRDRR